MSEPNRPLVISAPEPRTLDLIFTPERKRELFQRYEVLEVKADAIASLPRADLSRARYILGQPPISAETLGSLTKLRCVFNVEGNLLNNMPYEMLFERGIHVVHTAAVFALPVAEIGLGLALDLARGITDADIGFRDGSERWGLEGNASARLLSGSRIGIIGFGEVGKALNRLLEGFRAMVSVYDPWLPPSMLSEHGVTPATLEEVLAHSNTVFVAAAVTSDNRGFLDAQSFALMKKGAAFILLSRADVVDFSALMAAVERGDIVAASDVFPEEPLPQNHKVRTLRGFIRSAHRAGALEVAFKRMGDMVLEDMELMDRGLPPMRCKRAERETVSKMRSKPVSVN